MPNRTSIAASIAAISLCLGFRTTAADRPAIQQSVDKGVAWLASQQAPTGEWYPYGSASTGLVLMKLLDRAKELGQDPFTDFAYAAQVNAGFSNLYGTIGAGYPEGLSIYDSVYYTSIALMAIASTSQPDREIAPGVTYKQVAEGLVKWIEVNQGKEDESCFEGGWGYNGQSFGWSDQSNSGYASLALGIAAVNPPQGFGIGIPIEVLGHLSEYVENVQVTDKADPYYGGSIYEPCSGFRWVNTLKTGNLLYELALTGATGDSERVKAALEFIGNYWDSLVVQPEFPSTGLGWKGQYQAMFTMMKGLEALKIAKVPVGGIDRDWFDEMSTLLIANQDDAGFFNPLLSVEGEEHPIMRTAWALLALERAVPIVNQGIPDQCVSSGTSFAPIDADKTISGGTPPFTWTWAGESLMSVAIDPANVIQVGYPQDFVGQETITFKVTDSVGVTSNDPATFKVDLLPQLGSIPSQTAPFTPFDLESFYSTLPVGGGPEPEWSFSGNNCLQVAIGKDVLGRDDVVTVSNPGGCTEPEAITFTATAFVCGNAVSLSRAAVFTPNQPPACAAAVASQQCLWPPNNNMVPIEILGVTDPDGDPLTVLITAITSDEATATEPGAAGKNHAPDAAGVGTSTASVRAERSGLRDGRVYNVSFTASDGRGGVCAGTVAVSVPHDQSVDGCVAVDSGQTFDATTLN